MDVDPTIARPILEKQFSQYYRSTKSSLRNSLLRVDGTMVPKRIAIDRYPKDIDKVWWEKFVDIEYTDEKMEQCKKNSQNKAKCSITHTLGRKPYHRVHAEMALANPKENISRTLVWKAGHKRKSGEVLPCAMEKYALIEEAEEKRKFDGSSTSNGGVEDLENDPIAEVFGPDGKRSYCRAISSTSSIKQVKMTQAVKVITEKKQTVDFSIWKLEIEKQVANQVSDAIKSITSTFMKFIPNLQEKHVASAMTSGTEGASNLGNSHLNIRVPTPIVSHNDIHSSTMEKKYVMLLSHDLETDVAKGYVGTQTTCHFRKVVPNVEKVIWVIDVLEPEAPIYDGPQNGMYKLCEFSDGGFVIWPEFRIRYL